MYFRNLEYEANRLHWACKGSLLPKGLSEDELQGQLNRYFKKMWYNEEGYMYEDSFEDAWNAREGITV